MKFVLALIFVYGCSADTGSPVSVSSLSDLKSEFQRLSSMVDKEVQLRLEFEQNFLMHIRLLREMKEEFLNTVDNLIEDASRNVSSSVSKAKDKITQLELEQRYNQSKAAGLLRDMKSDFRKKVENLIDTASKNVSSNIELATTKFAQLEIESRSNQSKSVGFLQDIKQELIKTVDGLVDNVSKNVSSSIKKAENKFTHLGLQLRNNLTAVKDGKYSTYYNSVWFIGCLTS